MENKESKKAWDRANIEKRRKSDRESKRRLRALHGRKPYRPKTWEALEKKLIRDRKYSHRRYLSGLCKPSRWKFFSLDAPRNQDQDSEMNLHNRIASDALSPLEMLMMKEDALAYGK